MPPCRERTAAPACHQNRQIVMGMAVAILDATPVDDHALIEERAVPFASILQFLEEIGELLHVEVVDPRDLLLLLVVVLVMGKVVMTIADSDEGIRAVASVVGHDEGCDAG